MSHEQWLLYLDESGTFEPGTLGIVGGWLVRDFEGPSGTASLRRTLEALFPLIPYPPHATELKVTAAHLAGAALSAPSPRDTSEARALREVCRPVVESLEHTTDPLVRSFARDVSNGRWPERDAMVRADAWLAREHGDAHAALRRASDEAQARITALLSTARDFYGASDAFVIAAAGIVGEPATTSAPSGLVRDGYVEALEAAIERAIAVLRSDLAPASHVWMRVLTRRVRLEGMGAIEIDHLRVAELASQASRFPLTGAHDAKLRSIAPINRWDRSVHPGCVIADFICNRLYGLLHRAREWPALVRGAAKTLALPIEAFARLAPEHAAVPTLAATGDARRQLDRALREGGELGRIEPAWAASQAGAWLELARHVRGGDRP